MGLKLSRGHVPPGIDGFHWHFPVAPGVLLKAQTEELLVKLIFEYRMRNNIPVGDIEKEIDEYYCKKWPNACHPDYGVQQPAREPMLNRVTRWAAMLAARMPKGGFKLVSKDEADRRGAICGPCPRNKAWRGGCAGCSATTSNLLMALRQLRTSERQGNLVACDVTGADNLTAVHLPADAWSDTPEQKALMPENCWRKNS